MDKLIEALIPCLGMGYIYGADGYLLTEEKFIAAQRYYGKDWVPDIGRKWIGHKVIDCSDLIRQPLNKLGVCKGDMSADMLFNICNKIPKNQLLHGDLCFVMKNNKITHVGAYWKDESTIEAKSTVRGVIEGSIHTFNLFGRLKKRELIMDDYEKIIRELCNSRKLESLYTWLSAKAVPYSFSVQLLGALMLHFYNIKPDYETCINILDSKGIINSPMYWTSAMPKKIEWVEKLVLSVADHAKKDKLKGGY